MRRLPRAERRGQILAAATKAFARSGFVATSLDDVATEAGVTRVILYRHFDSKVDLYRAVIEAVCARLESQVGSDGFTDETLPALVRAAAADPDGFRLVFRYAAREPEFRDLMDSMMADGVAITGKHVAARFPDQRWAAWAAMLLPAVTIEAVIAWLDAGQPDPERAAERVARVVHGVIEAAGG